MTHRSARPFIAAAALFSIADGAAVPEWIHLLPAGELRMNQERGTIKPLAPGALPILCTFDGRDPIDRVPVDVNHANAKRGTQGADTPAYGWLVELSARADGLWGRVEWNATGRKAIEERSYRGVSAELMVAADGTIIGVRGASLTNHPNIKGLTPVFQSTEEDDTPMDKILKDLKAKLGLKDDATPDAVLQAVNALAEGKSALDARMAEIGKAAGAASDAKPEAVLQSVTTLAAKAAATGTGDDKAVEGLRAELQTVTTELNTIKANTAREKAAAFVDGAIAEGRVGVKPLREHYIERHMSASADVEKEIAAMPKLSGTTILPAAPPADGSLTDEEKGTARMMGISEDDFKKSKAQLAARNG